MSANAGLFGVGSALPSHIVTNADWEAKLDTSDEWIRRRTGIVERHWLNGDGSLASLAARAAEAALADAGRDAVDVDRIIVATVTPDRIFPGLAPEVGRLLGATNAAASDLNAACAGFLYGLDQAAATIESGRAETILVIGADALSRITDPTDRGTAVLFGDGAGAVVVGAGDFDEGLGQFELRHDGSCSELLYADFEPGVIKMAGQETYRHAIARMVEATKAVFERSAITVDDIDLFVAHQANARILDAVARELGLPEEKLVNDVARAANTSSASIPLALAEAQKTGRLQPGAKLAFAAFGGGFVWGAGVAAWKERARVVV